MWYPPAIKELSSTLTDKYLCDIHQQLHHFWNMLVTRYLYINKCLWVFQELYKSCYTIISWYTHSSRNIWFHCTFLKDVWKSSFKDISQNWNCNFFLSNFFFFFHGHLNLWPYPRATILPTRLVFCKCVLIMNIAEILPTWR